MIINKSIIIIAILFFMLFTPANAQYIIDLDSKVIEDDKTFYSGQDVLVSTNIVSLGATKDLFDITLSYRIIDENNNLIMSRESTLAIHTSLKVVEVFTLPEDIKSGRYSIIVKVTYDNYMNSVSNVFYVESEFLSKTKKFIEENPFLFGMIIFIIILILITIFLLIIHHYYKKH